MSLQRPHSQLLSSSTPRYPERSRGIPPLRLAAGYLGFARHDRIADQDFVMPEIGKLFVIIGVVIVVIGLILWTGIGTGFLGKLPGDIRIERGNSVFYFPVVTCIIISIVLSLLFSLFRR